jgi:hypothetical protein
METLRAAHGDEARDRIARIEMFYVAFQRQVRQPVRVICKEHVFPLQVLAGTQQPLTDIAVQAGVDEGDAPIVDVAAVYFDLASALAQVKSFDIASE